jgi:hypothetical protein
MVSSIILLKISYREKYPNGCTSFPTRQHFLGVKLFPHTNAESYFRRIYQAKQENSGKITEWYAVAGFVKWAY